VLFNLRDPFKLACHRRGHLNSYVVRLLPMNINRALLVLVVLVSTPSVFGDHPRKFDEIPAYFPWSDVMARLDNVAINFQREPSNRVLYLIAYAGRQACVGQADDFNLRAKRYLVRRGVASTRVILIDGGYLEKPMLDVWMLPSHVYPPEAVPNIDRELLHVRNCRKRSPVRR
jgi:hypothetical protein